MTYLDHAATTPMLPAAVEAMTGALTTLGNASSLHSSGRRARRVIEEARERIAASIGARPSEVIFTGGGTESDNLALKGIYWARRTENSDRRRVLVSAIEHHAVLDAAQWLADEAGAEVTYLDVDDFGRVHEDTLRAAIAEDPDRVALVSVMWANNEVGTVNPVRELAGVCAEHGIPFHTDAVQAVGAAAGRLRRASGASALTLTGHKVGGPYGVGVLLLGRDVACTPIMHGGGQERDVRSGTLDGPAIHALATAVAIVTEEREQRADALAALRDELVEAVLLAVPDAVLNGDPGQLRGRRRPVPAAGQRALHLPRLRGRQPADAAGRQGDRVLDRLGLHRGCRPAEPRAARHGRRTGRRPRLAAVLPRAHLHQRRRRRARRGDRAGRGAGPQRGTGRAAPRRALVRGGGLMRVLAAMSGGVDSAVAAARAVAAGHDVVGVHLALSAKPGTLRTGARGCCTVEDAHDARRVADILGIPFYVWDFAERFTEEVIDGFVAEYAAGRTPNPCLTCNEKIKFEALLDRAIALGFDAVCTGHYAQVSLVDGQPELRRSARRGQGPVLRARLADPGAAAARHVPARPLGQGRRAGRGRRDAASPWPRSPTATTSASSPTATPARS